MDSHSDADYQGGTFLEKFENLFGINVSVTPIQIETNSFQEDSATEKKSRLTLGNAVWLQMFVAGNIYKDISFFSELEHEAGSFKFNWFYWNFTNLANSKALNFQVGNISPLEFASYSNRLRQLPAIKAEVMQVKSSDSKGEESIDMSSARPGIQYYGYNNWGLLYAGVTPGTKATDVNQYLHFWGGFVFRLPENVLKGFEGSTATLHLYQGADTKFTGFTGTLDTAQVKNDFTRISPQINVRYRDKLDIQAAYVIANDDNWTFSTTAKEWKYSGLAVEAGYIPNPRWHFGLHYDSYSSDSTFASGDYKGDPIKQYQRVVPGVTYVVNQNIRFTLYYEKNLSDARGAKLVDKAYINMRAMF